VDVKCLAQTVSGQEVTATLALSLPPSRPAELGDFTIVSNRLKSIRFNGFQYTVQQKVFDLAISIIIIIIILGAILHYNQFTSSSARTERPRKACFVFD